MLYTPLLGIYQNQTHHLALNKGLMDSGLDSMCNQHSRMLHECHNDIKISVVGWPFGPRLALHRALGRVSLLLQGVGAL